MKNLSTVIAILCILALLFGISMALMTDDCIYVCASLMFFMVGFPIGVVCSLYEK